MRKIINTHKTEYFQSKIFDTYFHDLSLAVFDIETLGLNPKQNEIVLAAFSEVAPSGDATVTQYLLDSIDEEKSLLSLIREKLNAFDVILTYNGKHFDIPFIKTRARVSGLCGFDTDAYDITPYNLDLYLVLHSHSELKRILPDLKQKTVEAYMGISASRDDDISGAESALLYRKYLSTSDISCRDTMAKKILLHNHDDVLQLYKLLPVIKQTDFHKAMSHLGFPSVCTGSVKCKIESVKLSSNELIISGIHNIPDYSYMSFASDEMPYSVSFKRDFTFFVSVPVQKIDTHYVVNTRKTGLNDKAFESYAGFSNGFLILRSNKEQNNLEINVFAKELIAFILKSFL